MVAKLNDKNLMIMKKDSSFANLKLILLKGTSEGNRHCDKEVMQYH